ncbi:hypothetical protein fugu_013087 [Takifugu bimaculatus]|uniref:Peptidase S1 domain-containing protein n=1 Tax=Takifugu bimaculatus TaxID=433685 RepID=A0A4Z2C751_9TELE|nr:hypothetical protein fugu_013087 [Takifugu bimaculatus]
MKLFVILVIFVAFCSDVAFSRRRMRHKPKPSKTSKPLSCGERPEQRTNKIVNGAFADVESHPWIAAIFGQRFLCGGSLISPCWVVTAAHCFDDGDATDIRQLSVHLGKKAINETNAKKEQAFLVEKLIIHQHFDSSDL